MARIVVVDDSKASRTLLKSILVNAGHEVVAEAENGQAAISVCQAHQPDIVTLDIGMPVMDGISALKVIRADSPAIKVVMISAISEKPKVYTALELGAIYYIIKPFDAKFVTKAINDVLSDSFSLKTTKKPSTNQTPAESPFSISSDGAHYSINITTHFNFTHLSALRGAISAIAGKSPVLKLYVDSPGEFDIDALTGLLNLMKTVRDRGGQIELFDGNGQPLNMSEKERQDLGLTV